MALIGERFAAFIFDLAIYLLISAIWYNVFDDHGLGTFSIVPAIFSINLYDAICETFIRATLGKKITGIKVMDLEGDKITFSRSLIRSFIKVISILSFGGGILATFIAVSNSPTKQGLHDLWTGCIVVKSR